MAKKHSSSPESDLDKTDRLPILEGTLVDHDAVDGAVRTDQTVVLPGPASVAAPGVPTDFVRSSSVDLPSLAESVRSVEERITRQNADYETLTRAYERSRDAESAAATRANALAVDLAAARTALESEQNRSRDIDRALTDRSGSVEAARSRVEEALRESERYQSESRTLRDSLAARDSALAQSLHSLGERDAQLTALRTEHTKILPALEASSISSRQLEGDLQAARAQANALRLELQAGREWAAKIEAQLKLGESEMNAARSELGAAKTQASSYLELLRTREWRRGFDENLFSELDAQVGAAHLGSSTLESERERLQGQVGALEAKLAAQLAASDSERVRSAAELAQRDRAIAELREHGSGDARRVAELRAAAELRQAEAAAHITQLRAEQAAQMAQLDADLAGQIAQLKSEAETRDSELAVLMAHLQEARRPIQPIEADVKRLTEALAAKSAASEQFEEENRKLQATLERTRGALEEREFLIRRLERSESNNANALGRIQTSIERLGSAPSGPAAAAAAPPAAEWSAELIRIDGERPVTHVLSRRTRIGRAAGCELQIDSTSVSRNHALVVVGVRDAVIEDLNSTNGVIVNGRKVSRQPLNDGDAVTIGEVQFRYIARPVQRSAEAQPAEPVPGT
jgi:chromosome segregation ATPase